MATHTAWKTLHEEGPPHDIISKFKPDQLVVRSKALETKMVVNNFIFVSAVHSSISITYSRMLRFTIARSLAQGSPNWSH